MRVLVCPDKFKGSLTAAEATAAIARGVTRALPHAVVLEQPLADGGEGSLEILSARGVPGLSQRKITIPGPLRKPVQATYLLGEGRAVIECAAANGLQLVPPPRRHPKNTTTIGVGLLIEDALARGATDLTLLLGGSATSDAGAGMAAALGYRFLSARGDDFVPMADSLAWVSEIDASGRLPGLAGVTVRAACDVDAPLLGAQGTTHHYAAQKGAPIAELPALEAGMQHFAKLMELQGGVPLGDLPYAGAAGGLGAGAAVFLGARLTGGAHWLAQALDVERLANTADLLITGEGRVDLQTLQGKVVSGVLRLGRPTLVVCGQTEIDAQQLGAARILPIVPMLTHSSSEAMLHAAAYLEQLVFEYLATGDQLPAR